MVHNRLVREPEQKKPLTILRVGVTETAANTFTETAFNTPVSAAYFQAMRLHKVVFDTERPEGVEDVRTEQQTQLSTRSFTAMQNMNAEGMIARVIAERRWVSSAAGGESEIAIGMTRADPVWDFGEQGLLITDSTLHLATKGVGNVGPKFAQATLYYTLETLEPDEYVAALSVIGGQL